MFVLPGKFSRFITKKKKKKKIHGRKSFFMKICIIPFYIILVNIKIIRSEFKNSKNFPLKIELIKQLIKKLRSYPF